MLKHVTIKKTKREKKKHKKGGCIMFCMKCGTFLSADGVCPKCGARYKLPEENKTKKSVPKTVQPKASTPQGTQALQNAARVQGGNLSAGIAKHNWIAWAVAVPALIFLFFLVVYPCFMTLILAFVDYNPADGLFGSRFVGLRNIEKFFMQSSYDIRIYSNTMFYGIATLVLGSVYVFGATYGVASIKNIWLKCGVLSALLLPVFLPSVLVARFLLPTAWLNNPTLYRIGPLLNAVFCFAPITVLAGAFIGKQMPPLKCALFTASCYACLHLITLFSPESSYIFLSYSPLTYETADIFDTYIYRTAMLNFQYSAGAAVFHVKIITQIWWTAMGTIGLIFLANRERKRPLKGRQTSMGSVAAWTLGLVGVVLTVCVISAFAAACPIGNSGVSLGDIGVFTSLALSFGGWFIAALVAVCLSYGMANGGKVSKAVMLCIGGVVLLGWSNDIGRSILNPIADSKFGLILQYGTYGIFGAYLLFIASKGQQSGTWKQWLRKVLAPGAALSGVAFAKIFGDAMCITILHETSKRTFSNMLWQLIINVPRGVSLRQDVAVPVVVWVGCLIPVVVGLACIWLGGYLQNKAAKHK